MTCTQLCSESQPETYQCVKNLRHVVALVKKYETRVFEDNESSASWTAYLYAPDREPSYEPSYSYRSSDFASVSSLPDISPDN